jgi:hypothetical protein
VWTPLISHTVRTTAPPMPTAFGPRPPSLCHPWLHRRPCRPQSRVAICQPPLAAIKRTPLPVSSPFPPPPLHRHCAPVPPSLSHRETPPQSPSKLPDTALSSAPTPGAPSTSLPTPSAAPLLHRHRSPPLGLRRHGTPLSGEPSPLFGHQTGLPPNRLALQPLHRRTPAAGRPNFTGKSPVPMGEKVSLLLPWVERLRGLGREGRGQMGLAHSNSTFFII